MRIGASLWSSTVSYLITSKGGSNCENADIGSSHIATRKSFRICGKIIARKCGRNCEGNLPSHSGMTENASSSWDAIALALRHFFGRGKTTGSFSHLRSKDCSPRVWSRRGPTAAELIMSLLFPPCPDREPVLKVSNFFHQGIS